MSEYSSCDDIHEKILPHREQNKSSIEDDNNLNPKKYFLIIFIEFQHVDNQETDNATKKVCVDEILTENKRRKCLLSKSVLNGSSLKKHLLLLNMNTLIRILEIPNIARTIGQRRLLPFQNQNASIPISWISAISCVIEIKVRPSPGFAKQKSVTGCRPSITTSSMQLTESEG